MLRLLFVPALVFLFGFSPSVFASSAPAPECYPLVHGENGQGSTNSLYLPHLLTVNAYSFYVTMTNTSDEFVNVKLRFNSYDGGSYVPKQVVYYGMFNSVNSPFLPVESGAVLKPRETARVRVVDDSNLEALYGEISWQADSCIERALLVSVRNHYSTTSRFSSDLMLLNNGQPF